MSSAVAGAGTAPEAPAPAASAPCLIVMRHSMRLDNESPERQAALAPSAWPDRATRPFDTPICDEELPRRRALELRALLGGVPPVIISSPFRRTLQTAGIAARVLGVTTVEIDHGFGETMAAVRRCSGGVPYTPLSTEQMAASLGAGVSIRDGAARGAPPHADESQRACAARFAEKAAEGVKRALATGASILVVSHGDSLNHIGCARGHAVVPVPECSWLRIDAATGALSTGGGAVLLDFAFD